EFESQLTYEIGFQNQRGSQLGDKVLFSTALSRTVVLNDLHAYVDMYKNYQLYLQFYYYYSLRAFIF
ncbi:Uncharacterized protein APZ42_010371, partial [Daphnia magna]